MRASSLAVASYCHGIMLPKAFAWKCRASWPCVGACPKDFGACPEVACVLNTERVGEEIAICRRRAGPPVVVVRAQHRLVMMAFAGHCARFASERARMGPRVLLQPRDRLQHIYGREES